MGQKKVNKNDLLPLPAIKIEEDLTVVDDRLVYELSKTMLPVESIATILGCHRTTLYRKFGEHIQKGREERKQSLCEVMWEKALDEKDTKMMIWLSKQHLGYKDSIANENTHVVFNITLNEVPK